MSALIHRGESVPSQRRVRCNVFNPNTGQPAPRGTDFTGYVYVSQSTYKHIPATGTFTNKRRTLSVANDAIEAVDTVADTATMTAHLYETGDGPLSSDETIGALAIGADLYIISVDANTIAFAASLADAYAGTKVALTGTEVGATIGADSATERGLDGKFQYEFTQPEVDVPGCELEVEILGHPTYEGGASVTLDQNASSVWDADDGSGTGRTMGDLQRMSARTAGAKILINTVTGEFTVRDLDDTKDSHGGTVTESGGRVASVIYDLT